VAWFLPHTLGDLHIDGQLAETDLHIYASAHGFR
jgi:hypothetical protein